MFLRKILNLKNTLLFRLTILYAGIFTLLSFLAFAIFYYQILTVTMKGMDEELLKEIEEFSIVMAEAGLEGVKAAIAEEAESEDPNEECYRLINFNGDVLATTDMSSWGSVEKYNNLKRLQEDETNYIFQTLIIPGREYKARMISGTIGTDTVLQIGGTLEEAEKYLTIFRNLFAMLLIILMSLSAVIGWIMARQALLGMEQVTQTAIEISQGAYDKRVQVKDRYDEIKRLGSTFNAMLDRIQNVLRSMREINDNIAHDLRSPLARIRGLAEMTLMRERSVDEYKKMAASTVEECDDLIDLVNTMLDITEAESGVQVLEIEELDLRKLIIDAHELFQPIADEKQINVTLDLPHKLLFKGNRKKTQRIVTNLLENAIKYTPDRGKVSISAFENDGRINIIVEDTGIGIPEAELPHIFERFYQCDKSRTERGIGLGLSLAKAFVVALGGTLTARSTLDKGSTFSVTLPQ
ncbi:MAG: HAMP domain-containing histidine kinase [Nanoarchaeota archaeon]|nr:HAMP domain-containing histidine kinase [Nanoarchaeota archaeon]